MPSRCIFICLLIGSEHVRIFSQQKRNIGNTFLSSPSLRLPYNLLIKHVSHFFRRDERDPYILTKELITDVHRQATVQFFSTLNGLVWKSHDPWVPGEDVSKNPILKDCLGYPSGYPKVSSSRTPTCSHLVVWNMALKCFKHFHFIFLG